MVSLRSKPSVLAERDVHASELLPRLFLAYDQEHVPSNIMDVGAGDAHTLDAFAFYRSKLHFLDLFALELPEQGSDKRQQAYAHRAYSEVLGECGGVTFDLCLLWDLPLRLSRPALRGLSSALEPLLAPNSQAYAVGQLFAQPDGQVWRYRIQDAQHLARLPVTNQPGRVGATNGWSQQGFAEDFDCLGVVADRLQADSRLELLLGERG